VSNIVGGFRSRATTSEIMGEGPASTYSRITESRHEISISDTQHVAGSCCPASDFSYSAASPFHSPPWLLRVIGGIQLTSSVLRIFSVRSSHKILMASARDSISSGVGSTALRHSPLLWYRTTAGFFLPFDDETVCFGTACDCRLGGSSTSTVAEDVTLSVIVPIWRRSADCDRKSGEDRSNFQPANAIDLGPLAVEVEPHTRPRIYTYPLRSVTVIEDTYLGTTNMHVLLFLALFAPPQQPIHGKVISVHDGDTITVLVDKTQIKVRLEGIDAPESKQPFGTRSKQALSERSSENR
jgi:hypothetical protein